MRKFCTFKEEMNLNVPENTINGDGISVKSFAVLINIYKTNIHLLSYFYPVLDIFSSTRWTTINPNINVGMFVTLSHDASDPPNIFNQTIDTLKKRYPHLHINVIENRGYDIGALLYSFANIREYEYVLRLHSKSKIEELTEIINILAGTSDKILSALQLFSSNPKIALIGADTYIEYKIKPRTYIRNKYYLDELAKQYKFKQTYKYTTFIKGTIFWFRTSFFARLNKRLNFRKTYYQMNTINDLDWHWYYLQYKSIVNFHSSIHIPNYTTSNEKLKSSVINHWTKQKRYSKSKFAPNYYKASQLNHSNIIRDGMLGNAYERFFSWAAIQLNYTVASIPS